MPSHRTRVAFERECKRVFGPVCEEICFRIFIALIILVVVAFCLGSLLILCLWSVLSQIFGSGSGNGVGSGSGNDFGSGSGIGVGIGSGSDSGGGNPVAVNPFRQILDEWMAKESVDSEVQRLLKKIGIQIFVLAHLFIPSFIPSIIR